jgi:hypothetical protein
VAIGMKGSDFDRYLAIPFGVGVALVLDESALLLELEDVYWTEEGVVSVQIAFAAIAFLAAMAYLIRMLRQNEGQDSETDWEMAAKAWERPHHDARRPAAAPRRFGRHPDAARPPRRAGLRPEDVSKAQLFADLAVSAL